MDKKVILIIVLFVILVAACVFEDARAMELKKQYLIESEKNALLELEIDEVCQELNEAIENIRAAEQNLMETTDRIEQSKSLGMRYIGEYRCTAYCCEKYPHICGGGGNTASGKPVQADVTVAVGDLKTLPYGTFIYIEGVGTRIVQDTGHLAKNQIDVAVDTHDHALHFEGQGVHKVYILEIEGE